MEEPGYAVAAAWDYPRQGAPRRDPLAIGWFNAQAGTHFEDRLRLRNDESMTLSKENITLERRREYRRLWDAFHGWFRGAFRQQTPERFIAFHWVRLYAILVARSEVFKQQKRKRMRTRRETAKPCIEVCSAMVSPQCHGQCEHMCAANRSGHLGKHICVACFHVLNGAEAETIKAKEQRQVGYRKMAEMAATFKGSSAKQVELLAQMIEHDWPRVQEYCDPMLILDTSDEEDARVEIIEWEKRIGRKRGPTGRLRDGQFLRDVRMDVPVSSVVMKSTGKEEVTMERRYRAHTTVDEATNRVEIDLDSMILTLKAEDIEDYEDYTTSSSSHAYDGPTYLRCNTSR